MEGVLIVIVLGTILSSIFHDVSNFFYTFLHPVHSFFQSKNNVLDRNFQSISSSLIDTFSSFQ